MIIQGLESIPGKAAAGWASWQGSPRLDSASACPTAVNTLSMGFRFKTFQSMASLFALKMHYGKKARQILSLAIAGR